MSRKKRYIEKLTETEIQYLENGFKTGKSHSYRIRCKGLLLSDDNWDCGAIAEFFEVHLITNSYKPTTPFRSLILPFGK